MQDAAGKVAVVTGAATGIGRGMAQAFCAAGMKVVLADIDREKLRETTDVLAGAGYEVDACETDVADPEAVQALAARAIERHGKVHVLCNNAGIAGLSGSLWESDLDGWRRVLDVNLLSVVHGIRAFVPHMLAHGEPAHVVNTASIAAVLGSMEPDYAVSKTGVLALSESLYLQLRATGRPVSASVLCPAWVNTDIVRHAEASLRRLPKPPQVDPARRVAWEWVREQVRDGLDPREVGDMVLEAVREDRFYIFTHPDWNGVIRERLRSIGDATNPRPAPIPGSDILLQRLAALAKGE